jgi:hypothetical protein
MPISCEALLVPVVLRIWIYEQVDAASESGCLGFRHRDGASNFTRHL